MQVCKSGPVFAHSNIKIFYYISFSIKVSFLEIHSKIYQFSKKMRFLQITESPFVVVNHLLSIVFKKRLVISDLPSIVNVVLSTKILSQMPSHPVNIFHHYFLSFRRKE